MSRTLRADTSLPAPVAGRPAPAPAPLSLASSRRRRPTWTILGVVLVGIAGLTGGWLFTMSSHRISVLVAARDLQPGDVVQATDLRVVEVGSAGALRAVQPSQQDAIVGRTVRGPLPAGTVLNSGLFADRDEAVPAGYVVVAAALDAGAAPTGSMRTGDRVTLLAAARVSGAPTAGPAPTATVLGVGSVWSVEALGSGSVTSKWSVAVLVPAGLQQDVTQAAADGRLRISLGGAAS